MKFKKGQFIDIKVTHAGYARIVLVDYDRCTVNVTHPNGASHRWHANTQCDDLPGVDFEILDIDEMQYRLLTS
jgi:hypothetical protein